MLGGAGGVLRLGIWLWDAGSSGAASGSADGVMCPAVRSTAHGTAHGAIVDRTRRDLRPHNPKVAGSNPAPLLIKTLGFPGVLWFLGRGEDWIIVGTTRGYQTASVPAIHVSPWVGRRSPRW